MGQSQNSSLYQQGQPQPPPGAESGTLRKLGRYPVLRVSNHGSLGTSEFKNYNSKKKKNLLMTPRVSHGRELPPDHHVFTAYVCPHTINCHKSYLCHSVRPFLKIRMARRGHTPLIPTLVRQRRADL